MNRNQHSDGDRGSAAPERGEGGELLSAALEYAAQGIKIIPCVERGKKPALPQTGKEHAVATTDADQIRQWWTTNPDYNIGIVCSANQLAVIDIDGPAGVEWIRDQQLPMPATLVAITGRGFHYYYRWPAGVPIKTCQIAPKLEIRAAGAYVIAPPSVHPDGHIYQWAPDRCDWDAMPEPPPEWVAQANMQDLPLRTPLGPVPGNAVALKRLDGLARHLAEKPKGERHSALYTISRTLGQLVASRHLTSEQIEAQLLAATEQNGLLAEDGERNVAQTIADGIAKGIDDGPDPGHHETGERNPYILTPPDGTGIEWPSPSAPVEVAEQFLDTYREGEVLTLRSWRGQWMKWNSGVWTVAEDAAVRSELYAALRGSHYIGKEAAARSWNPTPRKISDVEGSMKSITHLSETFEPGDWIGADPKKGLTGGQVLISVKNGNLLIPERTLTPHDPDLLNLVQVPFEYDQEATAPRWDQFLEELWPKKDRDSVRALQEWFGYVVSGRTHLHKILLLVGPTRAGKSVSAGVLAGLVGRGNVASPSLATLGTNFGLQPLIGKALAIIPEARLEGRGSAQVVERLLTLSGEDLVTVDRKFKEPWFGKMTTRFLIVSNVIPRFGDASAAIAKRFVILSLDQSWLGKEDTDLTGKLEAELAGIFVWALDGLDRLTETGSFTQPAASQDAARTMEDLASPVAAFVRERCTTGHQYAIGAKDLFAAWNEWCEVDEGRRPGTATVFGRNLSAAFPAVRRGRRRDAGDRVLIYEGIALNPTAAASAVDKAVATVSATFAGTKIVPSDTRDSPDTF